MAKKRSRAGPASLDLPELVEAYLLACRAEGKSPNTLRWYRQKLEALLQFLEAQDLVPRAEGLTVEAMRAFIAHLQSTRISAFTARGYVQVAKGLFSWLEEEGYLKENHLKRLKLPQTPKYLVRPLEENEVRELLSAVKPGSQNSLRDLAIVLLLLDTGMRLGEIAGLTMKEGEGALRDGMLRVFGKGARERMVPVGPSCQNALRRYLHLERPPADTDALFVGLHWDPLTAEGIRQAVKRLAKRAGVPSVHPHRLRHTAAVTFLRAGGNVFALQRLLGHSSLLMTRNYVSLADADVKEAHRKASPADRLYNLNRQANRKYSNRRT